MQRIQRGLLAALVLVGVTGSLEAQVAERKGLTLEGAQRVIGGALAEARSGTPPAWWRWWTRAAT